MPRANLNRSVILDQAAVLADTLGYDRLSMAALARHFGVAVPSLYKHIPSLEAVQRALALRGARELCGVLDAAVTATTAGNALHTMAVAYRRYAHGYPGRYAAMQRAPEPGDEEMGAQSERVLAVVYGVLAGYGLKGEDLIDATRTLRSALHGFVTLEAVGGFGLSLDVERSFTRMIDTLDAAYRVRRIEVDA